MLSTEARLYYEDKGFRTTVTVTDQTETFTYLGARLKIIGKFDYR